MALVQSLLCAVAPVRDAARGKDVVQLVVDDHDRARELWKQYKLPNNTAAQKVLLAASLVREVSIHAAKEEEVLYPAMRDVLGELTPDHALGEHDCLKEGLAALAATPVWDPNHDGQLQDVMELLLQHMREEEEELLPRFAAAKSVTPNRLLELGLAFEQAKLHAPSRPHTWAPNKPPFNVLANALIAPLDFVADLVVFRGAPPL